jgi:hypothetical protein
MFSITLGFFVVLCILCLFRIIRWTYKKERELNDPWKSAKGQTSARLFWKREDGKWRGLSFQMPVEILRQQIEMAKKNKPTLKRA